MIRLVARFSALVILILLPATALADVARQVADAAPPAMGVHFVDVAAERATAHVRNVPGMGSGCSAVDIDNDGWVDLFLVQAVNTPFKYLHNLGNGYFESIAAKVGLDDYDGARTALFFDADNDGLLDLITANDCRSCPSSFKFYHQNPDHTFSDWTVKAGLFKAPIVEISQHHWGGICAGDINNDGYLDIFTGQWSGPAHLFLNNGDGTFKDISNQAGFPEESNWRHQPLMYDFNGDGWIDIYTAVDFGPNELWINQHDNTFVDMAPASGCDNGMNDMGMTLGDYDNDGDLDIYSTNIHISGKHNVLYRNDSVGDKLKFTEISATMGVDNGYWGWGTTWIDVDNDGFLDLAATNGWTTTAWIHDPSLFWSNRDGGLTPFVDVSSEIGFNDTDWGSALVAADLDRDGDLDLIQVCMASPLTTPRLRILDNRPVVPGVQNNYLVIQPRTYDLNRFAIGAVVRIHADGKNQMRLISAGTSYLGQEPAEAFFGVGQAKVADSVEIDWPDGSKKLLSNVPTNQVLKVMHPKPPKHVRIDIKPHDLKNRFELGDDDDDDHDGKHDGEHDDHDHGDHDALPVAILSDSGFDATQVDPLSIRLEGAPVKMSRHHGPRVRVRDVDHDGLPDLVVSIDTGQLHLSPTQTMATLTGELPLDQPIFGSDSIHIVGRHEHHSERDQFLSATALPTIEFALHGAVPNPGPARNLAISFALPTSEPATLELIDVTGRRLRSVDVGSLGIGNHVLNLGESGCVSAGLYFVRLTQGERKAVTRVAVVE